MKEMDTNQFNTKPCTRAIFAGGLRSDRCEMHSRVNVTPRLQRPRGQRLSPRLTRAISSRHNPSTSRRLRSRRVTPSAESSRSEHLSSAPKRDSSQRSRTAQCPLTLTSFRRSGFSPGSRPRNPNGTNCKSLPNEGKELVPHS
jgi:hypothetical protein